MQGVLSCLRLLTTSNLLLLSFVFLYSGLETSFWAGAFPSSVSFTLQLASRKMVRQNMISKSKPTSGDGSLQRDGSCWLNLGRGRTHPPQIFCQQSRSRTCCLYRSPILFWAPSSQHCCFFYFRTVASLHCLPGLPPLPPPSSSAWRHTRRSFLGTQVFN